MLRLVFVSVFLLGAVIGWLVVYFVRKYKEYNPKVLRDSMVLLLGGGCMDFLLSLIDKQVALYIIRKTKCYRFTKRNVPKRKTKRLRYRCPPEPYSNSVRTDFFSYPNAIILENQQINTSI